MGLREREEGTPGMLFCIFVVTLLFRFDGGDSPSQT